jgi:CRP/FNR family transcriptional regulator
VDQWMMQYKSWKSFVMTSYDNRLRELVQTIDNIVFHKLDDRLLDYLRKKAEANSSNVIHNTHLEIASDLNASREAISRLLKQFEKGKKIKLGRNKMELL